MKNLILGFKRGRNKWHGFSEALQNAGQSVDVVIDNFDSIEGKYDRIWCMAESLLPVQLELEKKYGLSNITQKAVETLINKKKFDDFCIASEFDMLVPYSVIPTCIEDLDYFYKKAFIIKPVIGSGSKQNFDTNIAYLSYRNKQAFLKSVPCDLLFYVNQSGFIDKNFNNLRNYYMAQEFLEHNTFYAPYFYANENGEVKHIFTVEGHLHVNKIDEHKFEAKPTDFMMVDDNEVPSEVLYYRNYFYETIVEKLQIKNMFFAGPDFYFDSNKDVKIIDCNPRIGTGLQILNEVHNNELLTKIILNKPFEIETKFWWVTAKIKPGRIKQVKNMSEFQKYFAFPTPQLKPGMVFPEFAWGAQQNVAKIILKIPGKNKSDMHETYQTLCEQLQNCIVY